MTTKQDRIKMALVAGAEAREMGKPEEPPKGLNTLEYASWRIGWEKSVPVDLDFQMIDIGDTGDPVRVDKLTEEEKQYWESYTGGRHGDPVERELRAMFGRFRSEHKHQPGEGAWFVFMHPQPEHAPILRDFVERHRDHLEAMAAERGRNGKVVTTRATYALAALGRIKTPQFTRPVDRTSAVTKEWLVEAGWTPTKDVTKKGNAHRPYWRRHDGKQGRVTVFAAQGGGWQIQLFIDGAPHYPWQTFPTAAAAYSTAHMHLNLEEPRSTLPAPEPEDWIAI
jgi:hypothetical protein